MRWVLSRENTRRNNAKIKPEGVAVLRLTKMVLRAVILRRFKLAVLLIKSEIRLRRQGINLSKLEREADNDKVNSR